MRQEGGWSTETWDSHERLKTEALGEIFAGSQLKANDYLGTVTFISQLEEQQELAVEYGDNGTHGLTLAEIESGGRAYVLQALADATVHDLVRVRAVRPGH